MDRAYEDDKTRSLAMKNGFIPVVPPKKNRKDPWNMTKNYINAEIKSNVIFEIKTFSQSLYSL